MADIKQAVQVNDKNMNYYGRRLKTQATLQKSVDSGFDNSKANLTHEGDSKHIPEAPGMTKPESDAIKRRLQKVY